MRRYVSIAIVFLAFSIVYGSTVIIKKYRTASDFSGGKSRGVTIRHDGRLTLAPQTKAILQQNIAQIWKLAKTKSGLYASTANPATVLAIDDTGDTTHVYSGKEAAIFALASDSKDRLWFAPSPGGVIYRFHEDRLEKMQTLEATYVWDFLAYGDDMLVATGIPGAILQISQTGQVDTFFASTELHIRTLAQDRSGNIYAGSSDNGMIYKFDRNRKASILYDSPQSEIFAIVPAADGHVWAAGAAEGVQLPRGQTPQVMVSDLTIESGGEGGEANIVTSGGESVSHNITRSSKNKGMVYKIAPSGFAKELWNDGPERVQSLALDADNALLIGTGDAGKIYRVREDRQIDMLLELKPSQVTHMLPAQNGIYLATANLGSCYLLLDKTIESGEYTSDVIDADFAATWGSLSWQSNGEVQLTARSGNSAEPDNTWSGWGRTMQNSAGSAIDAPPARYLQWRAVLKNGGDTEPALSSMQLGYLPLNVAPEISDISLFDFGTAFPDAVEVGLRSDMLDSRQGRNGAENNRRSQSFGKKVSLPGFVSIAWKASDPNEDELQFSLFYKAVGAANWRTLIEKYRNIVYSWDSRTMPDGEYLIKIVASDAPANVAGQVQTSEKISAPLLIDNSAPQIEELKVTGSAPPVLSFEASDRSSRITEAYYSVDAGEWIMVYPQDGVSDSREERYSTPLKNLTHGDHTVMVKIYDENQNIQFAHLDFKF